MKIKKNMNQLLDIFNEESWLSRDFVTCFVVLEIHKATETVLIHICLKFIIASISSHFNERSIIFSTF